MTGLFLLAAVLLAATLWWLTRPLRKAPVPTGSSERADLEQLRDRLVIQLRELDAERADRGIDSTVAGDEEMRLSAELASVLKRLDAAAASPATGTSPAPSRRAGLLVTLILAVGLVAVGGGLYAWRNGGNISGFLQAAESGVDSARVAPMVFQMVARLEQRLKEQPNDADGWARLGRAYAVLQRNQQARDAYARAYALAPGNVAVLSDYAWLVFNEDPTNTSGLTYDLYSRLYKLEPSHPDALWFLGFASFQHGDYRKAVTLWERLLKLLPPDDPGRAHLQQAIDSAHARLAR